MPVHSRPFQLQSAGSLVSGSPGSRATTTGSHPMKSTKLSNHGEKFCNRHQNLQDEDKAKVMTTISMDIIETSKIDYIHKRERVLKSKKNDLTSVLTCFYMFLQPQSNDTENSQRKGMQDPTSLRRSSQWRSLPALKILWLQQRLFFTKRDVWP